MNRPSLPSWPISLRVVLVVVIGVAVFGSALGAVVAERLESEMRRQAVGRQETSLAVAWEVLRHQGAGFRISEGTLYAGSTPLNNKFDVVGRIQSPVGGVATVSWAICASPPASRKADGNPASFR